MLTRLLTFGTFLLPVLSVAGCDSGDLNDSVVGDYDLVRVDGEDVPTEDADLGITSRCGSREAYGTVGGFLSLRGDGTFETERRWAYFCISDGREVEEGDTGDGSGVYTIVGNEIRFQLGSGTTVGALAGDAITLNWSAPTENPELVTFERD